MKPPGPYHWTREYLDDADEDEARADAADERLTEMIENAEE